MALKQLSVRKIQFSTNRKHVSVTRVTIHDTAIVLRGVKRRREGLIFTIYID